MFIPGREANHFAPFLFKLFTQGRDKQERGITMESRTRFIGFRASEKERHAILTIAEGEGVRLSEAIRLLVREGAARRGYMPVGFLVEKPRDSGEVRQP